jgi:hypothetical protein
MMILPGFLTAQTFKWDQSESINFALNDELVNSQLAHATNGHVAWIALSESLEHYGQHPLGNRFIRFYTDEVELVSSSMINGSAHVSRSVSDSSGNLYVLMLIRDSVFFVNGSDLIHQGIRVCKYPAKMYGNHVPESIT